MRYLPEEAFDEWDARRFVFEWGEGRIHNGYYPEAFAVLLKADDHFIGHMLFHSYHGVHRTREIGWSIHPDYQGKGYASEAAAALLEYGFKRLNLHRVVATCDTRNAASMRVMEKIGMHCEGTLRKCLFLKGEWIDERLYARALNSF